MLANGHIRHPADLSVSAALGGLPVEWGAMDIHYILSVRLGITGDKPRVNGNGTYTDWMVPAIPIYGPLTEGSLEVFGVENLVWQAAWVGTGKRHPVINGHSGTR